MRCVQEILFLVVLCRGNGEENENKSQNCIVECVAVLRRVSKSVEADEDCCSFFCVLFRRGLHISRRDDNKPLLSNKSVNLAYCVQGFSLMTKETRAL